MQFLLELRGVLLLALAVVHGASITTAQAQRADDYPSKPIRMIVPFAP